MSNLENNTMKYFDKLLRALVRDESGQDMIEYSLVAALIGLAAIVSIKGLSTHIASAFTTIGTNVTSDV
jgi:pilus assembly protein Flp/PilA